MAMPSSPAEPAPREIIAALQAHYGPQHWWPGETRLEIIVGAVLTQNTNWRNVSLAIDALRQQGLLLWEPLLAASDDLLRECIRPSGVYNVKLQRLRHLLAYLEPFGLDHPRFGDLPLEKLRAELLAVHGIGPETADSILLYAFQRPTFVIDAFTRRLFARLGAGWMARGSYAALRAHFMAALPAEVALYNEAHALIVRHSKDICRARPLCATCLLLPRCPHGQNA
jgi:endonuclease-3 related protein